MPELDYMVLADYVRTDNGNLHIMGAGIDTIIAAKLPAARNVGIALRLTFDSTERPGIDHRIELIFQSSDQVLAKVRGELKTPPKPDDVPVHWKTGVVTALQIGLPLPQYGDYSIELTLDDKHLKSIDLRVVPPVTGS
ncbi:hypothetical protein AB0K60_25500 [Thermopolyspora sp. NPDC052614]|uniref:DUF6941 family protein n=1 Tax=Thermopolyspora sp. NPDC052614 TaxID=3155682 RepID=UPI003423C610